ncbi:MAG: HAD family hydrolase [Verrucomicrobiales bacterium]
MKLQDLGVIFDWDGVVIDSSEHHETSWERLSAETGLSLPEDHFKRGFGMKNEVIIPHLLNWTHDPEEIRKLSLRKEELYREVVQERGIWALRGVTEFLSSLREAGIPRVIGSSTHRLNIETTLETLGLEGIFTGIISAEDVSKGKPDPEVFLKAAQRIGRAPAACVVIEDALVGIEAAHAAGMKVVAVATTNDLEQLSEADFAVASLSELGVQHLLPLFSAKVVEPTAGTLA